MPKLFLLFLFVLILLININCYEVVINIGNLPNDSLVNMNGPNDITLVIPNRNATNLVTIAFPSERRWANSTTGCLTYGFTTKITYGNLTQLPPKTLPFAVGGVYGGRVLDIQCDTHDINTIVTTTTMGCSCSPHWTIFHTGKNVVNGEPIPDNYYPVVVHINSTPGIYTHYTPGVCSDMAVCKNIKVCECAKSPPTETFEDYDVRYPRPMVSNATALGSNVRFLSAGNSLRYSVMVIVLLICYVLYLQ